MGHYVPGSAYGTASPGAYAPGSMLYALLRVDPLTCRQLNTTLVFPSISIEHQTQQEKQNLHTQS